MARPKRTTPYHSVTVQGNGWMINAVLKHSTLEESKEVGRRLWQAKDDPLWMKIKDEKFNELFKHSK